MVGIIKGQTNALCGVIHCNFKRFFQALTAKVRTHHGRRKNITGTVDATYPETVVVSTEKGVRAEKIANALGLKHYMYNKEKNTGSAITIVIGNDFIGKE